jgi:peroxiredoxin
LTSSIASFPGGLPEPHNDGAAAHLVGLPLPDLSLPSTSGDSVRLSSLQALTVIYIYPMTGRPGIAMPDGWDLIPGARGCTPEACGFRDHHAELKAVGTAVYGLSSQSVEEQHEAVSRLHLPFALLSDQYLQTAEALTLPTFEAGGRRLFKRLTLVVLRAMVEHIFYPVFPPDRHAEEVLEWLQGRRKAGSG